MDYRQRKPIVVTTTSDDKDILQKIADELLCRRLAACVQISGPVESSYWWNGKIERTSEWMCSIKTFQDCFRNLEQTIQSLHNYDQPQLLSLEIDQAAFDYLRWMSESVVFDPLPNGK